MLVIGIDSHKDTLSACLVGPPGHGPGVPDHRQTTPAGHRQLVSWAQTTNAARVAVEGSGTFGRPLAVAAVGAGPGCPGGATAADRPLPPPGPYPDQNRPGRRVGDRPGSLSGTTPCLLQRFGRTPRICVCWSHTAVSW